MVRPSRHNPPTLLARIIAAIAANAASLLRDLDRTMVHAVEKTRRRNPVRIRPKPRTVAAKVARSSHGRKALNGEARGQSFSVESESDRSPGREIGDPSIENRPQISADSARAGMGAGLVLQCAQLVGQNVLRLRKCAAAFRLLHGRLGRRPVRAPRIDATVHDLPGSRELSPDSGARREFNRTGRRGHDLSEHRRGDPADVRGPVGESDLFRGQVLLHSRPDR